MTSTTGTTHRKTAMNPFGSILQDSTTDAINESNNASLQLVLDDDDDVNDGDENREKVSKATTTKSGPKKSRKSLARQHQARRRRRSSARFLRMGQNMMDDDEEEEDDDNGGGDNLSDMYQRAIRMNAENRINASSAWNLKLIENLDKLTLEDAPLTSSSMTDKSKPVAGGISEGPTKDVTKRTVNFTKASCTLDASVKIYSYRVDDVHLTSYKVLANLNRNDAAEKNKSKNKKKSQDTGEHGDQSGAAAATNKNASTASGTETLEVNVANLNLNKLDSAYDIDPLFHKMSKTFDEGGAKGLLLVNLGVGDDGCKIVFDSKEETNETEPDEDAEGGSTEIETRKEETVVHEEGMMDISSLVTKLVTSLGTPGTDSQQANNIMSALQQISLVPQLRDLRNEYADLQAEGYVDNTPEKRHRRYASTAAEEKEAEISIHQEAQERSRASQLRTPRQHEEDEYGADDFGGDDDGDFGDFGSFLPDNGDNRFSSASFQNGADSPNNATSQLLDTILDNNDGLVAGSSDYDLINKETLEKLQGEDGNGSQQHWKKAAKKTKKKPANNKSKSTTKKKRKRNTTTKKRQKKKGQKIQIDLSDPTVASSLADAILQNETPKPLKHVEFSDQPAVQHNDWDGDDYDDGPGFDFGGGDDADDDFVVSQLDDVRKVQKVRVEYATVAKKVDVKRLKKELWSALEQALAVPSSRPTVVAAEAVEVVSDDDDAEEDISLDSSQVGAVADGEPSEVVVEVEAEEVTGENKETASDGKKSLSFQEMVQSMDASQSQGDVTLPFYFICLLHLANEKGLKLESKGLNEVVIEKD